MPPAYLPPEIRRRDPDRGHCVQRVPGPACHRGRPIVTRSPSLCSISCCWRTRLPAEPGAAPAVRL